LVEILIEGCISSLEEAGYSEGASLRYAMLLFYAGCVLVMVLDLLIGLSSPYAHIPLMAMSKSWKRLRSWGSRRQNDENRIKSVASIMEAGGVVAASAAERKKEEGCGRPSCDPVLCDPVLCEPDSRVSCPCHENEEDVNDLVLSEQEQGNEEEEKREAVVDACKGDISVTPSLASTETIHKLKKMGMLVAISMAIHNFPEGIAVFLGALKDTDFGASIAIAIAVHNIPEGFCISLPVYYATGSRWKAFFWTLIPSLAEPLGGLMAYLAFHSAGDLAFGIAFGIVAGIMVYVSVMELLPAAFKFDPENKLVTIACMLGMVVMALSLILLSL